MNRLYERTTRRCTPSLIDAALSAEIAAHAEAHQLGDVLGAGANCFETWNVRLRKPGPLFRLIGSSDPDTAHRTVVVVGSRYVVVAVEGRRRGFHVRSARLDGVSLSGSSELYADFGVSVAALWSGGQEAASFYIGVGDDPEGHAFLDELYSAVARAKSA
ncbi:hypothetical protein [Streptomyces sp. NBC_01262]|uniref:hypothetical protein n=1 Tax=Streptomyces sp. NBC_01262 TaxID=2903803 RepID=UPI002E2F024B|nr:hypothetical protein [Streptomyces sp. NBC_01262]